MKQSDLTQTGRARPVCVITTQGDVTADRVILHLAKMNVPVIRFDLADFPQHVQLDATLDHTGWHGTLHAHGREVRLEEIGAIYWWHPKPAGAPEGLQRADADWVGRESTVALTGVLGSLDCLHVNHPRDSRSAQRKPHVLTVAQHCGLAVPPTWIGNHLSGARFFAKNSTGVSLKSLESPRITHPDGMHRELLTTPVEASQLDDSLTLAAHQLQHTIIKDHEVRLVVVGHQMHAARIDAHSPAARADFRADYAALTYSYTSVPEAVRAGVRGLMDHYHLVYAALDLLVDGDGCWWLVDLNPAGQHDWLQCELPRLTIAASLARMLAAGRT
ncbi:MvdC/MvdD family ATP grasp protein [Streptomyces sp. MAR4 CNX-425]|uniref:MvdC/MvdD family ATP grasp protein n=1 Tax=Streptomyces sp. MAR4 CNX-425 TaxID=3406343 RepID=UPI003B50A967